MSAPLGSRRVAQIAIVVRDIEASGRRWAALLGLPEPSVIITQPGDEVRMTYRGRPSHAQTKLAFLECDNLQIELVEPMGGDSVWQSALDERGEHVQHIAFWVEDYAAATDALAEAGAPEVQRGDMGDGQYGYFDGSESLGLTIELLQRVRPADQPT